MGKTISEDLHERYGEDACRVVSDFLAYGASQFLLQYQESGGQADLNLANLLEELQEVVIGADEDTGQEDLLGEGV